MNKCRPIDDPYFHAFQNAAMRITGARLAKGLSTYMLAKLAGVDIKQLRACQNDAAQRSRGSVELSVRMAIRLSVPLDTTPQYLLFGVK